jgi:hypothetical protein
MSIAVVYAGMHALWEDVRGDEIVLWKNGTKVKLIQTGYFFELRNILVRILADFKSLL